MYGYAGLRLYLLTWDVSLMKKRFLFAFVAVQLACGSPAELGAECEDSGGCTEGLECRPMKQLGPDANGEINCVDAGSVCSQSCSVDADCAALGERVICISGCGSSLCLRGSRS